MIPRKEESLGWSMHTMIMSGLSISKQKCSTMAFQQKNKYPAKSVKKPETQGRNTLLDTRITKKGIPYPEKRRPVSFQSQQLN